MVATNTALTTFRNSPPQIGHLSVGSGLGHLRPPFTEAVITTAPESPQGRIQGSRIRAWSEAGTQINPFGGEQTGEGLPVSGDPQAVAVTAERLADRGVHRHAPATIAVPPATRGSMGGTPQGIQRPARLQMLDHRRGRHHL